jgi:hypothetical protein
MIKTVYAWHESLQREIPVFKKILLSALFLCVLLSNSLSAAEEDVTAMTGSTSLKIIYEMESLFLYFNKKSNSESNRDLGYESGTKKNIGFEVSSHNLNLGFTFGSEKYREWDNYDLRNNNIFLSYFSKHHGVEFINHYARGMTSDYKNGGVGENPEYEEMEIRSILLSYYYFFSEDPLYNEAFKLSKKIRRGGGSFFIKVTPGYFSFKNNGPVIPQPERSYFGKYGSLEGMKCYSFSLTAGGLYTLTFKGFFITPMVNIGPDIVYQEYNTDPGISSEYKPGLDLDFSLSYGYDNGKEFAAMIGKNENQVGSIDGYRLQVLSMQFLFFAGMRF